MPRLSNMCRARNYGNVSFHPQNGKLIQNHMQDKYKNNQKHQKLGCSTPKESKVSNMYWHCTEHRLQLLHALGARTPGSELAVSGFIACCWIPIRVGKLWDTFGSASCSRMFAPSVPQDIHLWSATLPFTFPLTSTGFCSLPLNEKTCPARSLCQLLYGRAVNNRPPTTKGSNKNRDRHLDKSADCKLPRGARLRHTECRQLVRFAQPASWRGPLH